MTVYGHFVLGVRLAFKARYFALAFLVLLSVLLSAALAAQFSGRQPATVALDVGISMLRLLLPLVVALLAQELICREFDRRYYLISFSYPGYRWLFLVGRFLAVFGLTAFLMFVVALFLRLVVDGLFVKMQPSATLDLGLGYFVVLLFMQVDLLVLSAVSCLLAVIARTNGFALVGTLGFMLIARSYGAIIQLLSENFSAVSDPEAYKVGLSLLGYLIPDLGGYDVRAVALYGGVQFLSSAWPLQLTSGLLYALGVLGLAVLVINRKRFV